MLMHVVADIQNEVKRMAANEDQWTVRGISFETRRLIAAAADRAGMKVGAWVDRALRAALERSEGQGAPSKPKGAGDDLRALVTVLAAQMSEMAERVERLEADQVPPAIPGLPSGDSGKGRMPAAIPSRQGSAADVVKLVEGAEVLETAETHSRASDGAGEGKQTRQKWTDADDDVLRRTAAEGGTQADAVRELGRPSSVVNGKWKALGLPVLPRKGRKLKR